MNIYEKLSLAVEQQRQGQLALAEHAYLEVLSHDARNADAHHLLGCLYKSLGRIDQGIASISISITIDPRQAMFFNNLGTCYLQKEEFVVAELCFRHALSINAQNVDALSNLATLLSEHQRMDEALKVLEQALLVAPEHEHILNTLSTVYLNLDRYEQALQIAQRGSLLYPNSVLLALANVSALAKLNRNADALALIISIADVPTALTVAVMKQKGRLQEVLGQLDEACATYDLALRTAPHVIALLHARVQIRSVKADDLCLQQLLEFEPQANTISGIAKTQLHFALGKACQDIGDMVKAAENYALGAANHLRNVNYDENVAERVCQKCWCTAVLLSGLFSLLVCRAPARP
jgi:tetratricopeptide (TPR) repeat protein